MQQDNLKDHYMKAMGVDVYRLRDQEATPELPVGYQCALMNEAGKQIAWSLIDSHQLTQEEIELHTKICAALKLQPVNLANEPSSIDWAALAGMPMVFVFGSSVLPHNLQNNSLRGQIQHYLDQPFILTERLVDLVADPQRKKQAWAELKLFLA